MASRVGGLRGGRVVGDYMIGRQIGSGSFSVVWLARHRVTGLEVAVKEIIMDKFEKKVQKSLRSEIEILKRTKHPNIIALLEMIEASDRIFLILEYCKGGDLAVYLHKQGKVSETTAKHFMQQLASGLYCLYENNFVHRDLKPQNLLLSASNENSVLKIADFGFARLLEPRVLAETLCGSPLYMAPEIMHYQKYDAKADLWSVGAILFQLVTGKTPFTGSTQVQLLENIYKSKEVHFPPENNLSHDCIDLCKKLLRRNPVERITFEEFFNHPFLSRQKSNELTIQSVSVALADFGHRSAGRSNQACLLFPLDDESAESHGSLLTAANGSPVIPTYGFNVGVYKCPTNSSKFSASTEPSSTNKMETSYGHDSCELPSQNTTGTRPGAIDAKQDPKIVDSLDLVDQEYVIVSRSPLEMSSSLLSFSELHNSTCKSDYSLAASRNSALSTPMPIFGVPINKNHTMGSLESHSYPQEGSMDLGDTIEQPSAQCITRIRLLQKCTSVMTELLKDELENGRRLEAFSIQLLILAILKESLHICHTQAVVAADESPSETTKFPQTSKASSSGSTNCFSSSDPPLPYSVSSEIEKEFLISVERAEELAKDVGQVDEATYMPDAIELIFESALAFGRRGAVDEMKNMESAEGWYSKAVSLLHFLLVEAPSLALNPPVCLTHSDRQRLRTYIYALSTRNSRYRLQRMTP
ncbi:serine/threonine-protein kinase ATG1c-like [Phalaenopsis equestris]|uniref:serine/threonine-protein kinase ATG1c-like n=1 Tax=Phalaenopsis equestris TaxID=78828 RepID=UPI0009E2C5B4|nr:serine/threonine-protein kinase ATG1c-like [Phalaenopsis equestris]XP_020588221.1 serine/threonine-protein kinase ATG1c-like [Phalaenopsis equestris]